MECFSPKEILSDTDFAIVGSTPYLNSPDESAIEQSSLICLISTGSLNPSESRLYREARCKCKLNMAINYLLYFVIDSSRIIRVGISVMVFYLGISVQGGKVQ